jgi:hypothetical protein
MRLLRFNGFSGDTSNDVDIDDKTAIGITLQSFDIKDPSVRKISISNSFTIPKTAHNMKILESVGNVQSLSDIVYRTVVVEY